jgi:transposase
MKAYTQELRERIVAAVDRGVPREEVADVFGVGLSTIKRYLKQRRETGSMAAKPIPGRPAKKLGP